MSTPFLARMSTSSGSLGSTTSARRPSTAVSCSCAPSLEKRTRSTCGGRRGRGRRGGGWGRCVRRGWWRDGSGQAGAVAAAAGGASTGHSGQPRAHASTHPAAQQLWGACPASARRPSRRRLACEAARKAPTRPAPTHLAVLHRVDELRVAPLRALGQRIGAAGQRGRRERGLARKLARLLLLHHRGVGARRRRKVVGSGGGAGAGQRQQGRQAAKGLLDAGGLGLGGGRGQGESGVRWAPGRSRGGGRCGLAPPGPSTHLPCQRLGTSGRAPHWPIPATSPTCACTATRSGRWGRASRGWLPASRIGRLPASATVCIVVRGSAGAASGARGSLTLPQDLQAIGQGRIRVTEADGGLLPRRSFCLSSVPSPCRVTSLPREAAPS